MLYRSDIALQFFLSIFFLRWTIHLTRLYVLSKWNDLCIRFLFYPSLVRIWNIVSENCNQAMRPPMSLTNQDWFQILLITNCLCKTVIAFKPITIPGFHYNQWKRRRRRALFVFWLYLSLQSTKKWKNIILFEKLWIKATKRALIFNSQPLENLR